MEKFLNRLSDKAKAEMAMVSEIPDEIWHILINDKSEEVRSACCCNPRILSDEVDMLLCDKSRKVRISLARDAVLSEEQCFKVIRDDLSDWVALCELAKKQALTDVQIDLLLERAKGYENAFYIKSLIDSIFSNKAVKERHCRFVYDNFSNIQSVCIALASYVDVPKDILKDLYFSESGNSDIMECILRNKGVSEAILYDAYSRGICLEAIRDNPSTPCFILDEINRGLKRGISSAFV